MAVTAKIIHAFQGAAGGTLPVELTIIGDTPAEVLDALLVIDGRLTSQTTPVVPAPVSEVAQPTRAAAAAKDKSLTGKHTLDKALRILTDLYKDDRTRPATRGLLDKYGVKKFGEIDVARADELLNDAEAIKAGTEN